MKKKIKIIGLALLLAMSVSACGLIKGKEETKENKETKETKKEENLYSPILADDVEIPDVEYPYMIKVNKAANCITVYTLDIEEDYTVPVRSLICSVGDGEIPEGTFQLGETTEWEMLSDGSFGRHVTRIVDNIMLHSVSYTAKSEDALDVEAYNHLGDTISGNSIVLGDADAQWIAENCPEGTKIEIYSDEEKDGPLGKPWARLISDKITWDPTDPSSENAWYVPVSFFGIEDKVIKVGETADLLSNISAKDKYGNDLTQELKVYGEVNSNKAGEYEVTYSCKNADGDKRNVSIKVKVEGEDAVLEASAEETSKETKKPEETKEPEKTKEAKKTKEPEKTKEVQKTEQPVIATTQPPTPAPKKAQEITTVTTITTVEQVDNESPQITFVANSPYVASISDSYLRQRISVSDNISGIEGVYISVCRVPENGSYIVVYEVFDNAGNSSCVSETVYLN